MGGISVIIYYGEQAMGIEFVIKGRPFQTLLSLLTVFSFLICNYSYSQTTDLISVEQISEQIVLDGISNEPAWGKIQPVDLTMHQPIFGNEPSEQTEIRFAYDKKYLYASGRFYDSEPTKVRGTSLERDGISLQDDQFGIILDTFNDNENALVFAVSPTGVRGDWTIINDAETTSGSPMSKSWNTFWDAEVVKNNEGWFVEVRIPFSSLRFQNVEDKIEMGLITWRYIARKNEIDIYPAIPPNWELSHLKPSVGQDITMQGIKSKSPLYITPYFLSGLNQSSKLNNLETAYNISKKSILDLGLDLKYGLSSDLTLDVTINTDFAQVEVDDPQINFTRFSLFFPEKRLFFQERAGLFNFNFAGPKMFYTRRIGLYDIGDNDFRQIPIYAGTRLVGKIGDWDVGFLDMQTASKDFKVDDYEDSTVTVPSENFGVLRLRRQILNPYSYIGTMLTSRIENGGKYNYCYGLDGTIRLSDHDYFTFTIAQSVDSQENPSNLLDANRIRLTLEKRSKQGFGYNLYFVRRGLHYIPRMGFEVWKNYYAIINNLSYSWQPKETSPIFRNTLTLGGYFLYSNTDNRLESAQLGPAWIYEGKNGSYAKIWLNGRFEGLSDTLSLPEDVYVPSDRYLFYEVGLDYNMSSGKLLRSNVSIKGGPFFDGSYFSIGISPNWTISRHLTVSGSYQPTWADFSIRNQSFITHIFGIKANIALNTKLSTNTFLLYNSAAAAAGINFRLRYNPKEGTDFYLVYNEGLNTDRERELPNLPISANRSVLLKYSMTFVP